MGTERVQPIRGRHQEGDCPITQAIREGVDERDIGTRQAGHDIAAGLFAIAAAVDKLTAALSESGSI